MTAPGRPSLVDAIIEGLDDARPKTRFFGSDYFEKRHAAMVAAFVYSSCAILGLAKSTSKYPVVAGLVWDGTLTDLATASRDWERRRDSAFDSLSDLGLMLYYTRSEFPELYSQTAMLAMQANPRLLTEVAGAKLDVRDVRSLWETAAKEGFGLGIISPEKAERLLLRDFGLQHTGARSEYLDERMVEIVSLADALIRDHYPELRPSKEQQAEAERHIVHLQTMWAYQQLSMETYNDALSRASQSSMPNAVGAERPFAEVSSPEAAHSLVLPALREKIRIFQLMDELNQEFSEPQFGPAHAAHEDFVQWLFKSLERALDQYEGFERWINDPNSARDEIGTRLDAEEDAALTRSTASLNALIEVAGMSYEEWRSIDFAAFNSVRDWAGMQPLTFDEFSRRRSDLLSGLPVRFFSD